MKERVVIIPTYNEIENIEGIIEAVFALPLPFDVLIIDDGSPDGTAQKVQEMQQKWGERLLLEQRKGKMGLGTAYLHGFAKALAWGYEYIFEMDADFSHDPKDLMRLYQACAEGQYDVAIGSRYIKGVNVVNWPMSRVLMSYFASMYVRLITGMPIMDATAGFKCYRRRVLETIPLEKIKFVGYAFQIEMKFTAWKYGFKVVEVPIIFTDRTKGVSKMSSKIFKEAFLGVIQMKIQSLFRTYRK
jgi:dolichol-phosphate mannosyltransferase